MKGHKEMSKSKAINELAAALSKAQSQCKPVKKSGINPHLKSEYVTLDDIINAIRKPLADNGLAYTQLLHGTNGAVKLTTLLMHESGQWLKSTVVVESSGERRGINAIQALGSSITYMKRYALSAMLGIAAEVDDDGNGAQKPQRKKPAARQPEAQPAPVERPLRPETIRQVIRKKSGWIDGQRFVEGEPITEGQVGGVNGLLTDTVRNLPPDVHDQARHDVLNYLLGVTSSKALTKREASAIISWLKVDVDGQWDLNAWATAEVSGILEAVAVEQGQLAMEIDA
jgi:hypothetical protein